MRFVGFAELKQCYAEQRHLVPLHAHQNALHSFLEFAAVFHVLVRLPSVVVYLRISSNSYHQFNKEITKWFTKKVALICYAWVSRMRFLAF